MTQDQILSSDKVKNLIKTMDLDAPPHITLNVSDYSIENGFIVINEIEVLDGDGNHLRFAELEKVISHLDKYEVTFNHHG
tara:strand:+ start:1056 stop:1295 length:240 start_codon:yes stop_codon:yes gene_type:complete